MSADDRSTNYSAACCQWLDELPRLGPVTLNAFDRRLWESLLDCNGNNNSRRGETFPAASALAHGNAEEEVGERRRRRVRAAGRQRQHVGPSPPLHLPPAYRRQISALRQASRAYRRLQTMVGRLRRSVERRGVQNRHPAPQSPPSTARTEEEPYSSAMSQDDDGLACCRNRHPPGRARFGRPAAHLDELSTSSSWRSEFSARLFVPRSAVSASIAGRWQQQQWLQEQEDARCPASLAHIGATLSRAQQLQRSDQEQQQHAQSMALPPTDLTQLQGTSHWVSMEFSADDSTFSRTESPIVSLASLENDHATLAAPDAAVMSAKAVSGNIKAERPRRSWLLLPPAPLQVLSAPPMHVARVLPTQRQKRQQRWQKLLQQQHSQCRRFPRSCCIAVASQRLCPACDGGFAWARRGYHYADFGFSRACCQCLGSAHDFSQPLESLQAPLHCPLLLECVWPPVAFKQVVIDPAASSSSAIRWCLLLTAPGPATALRFVAAGALTPEPAEAAPPAPPFWHGAPSVANSQPSPQPLYRWPPPPAGSLIDSRSAASPSQVSQTAATARSNGGRSSFGGSSSAGGRERLQQQRKLRRIVQVMQMRRKPSDTDYIVAPIGGDCRSSSCHRCELLEGLLRATGSRHRDATHDLLTTSTRFYSFGGGECGTSASVTDSRSGSSCAVDEVYGGENASGSSSISSSSRMFFATPDSALCLTANNNADASNGNTVGSPIQQQQQQSSHRGSHRRRRTYYARRCIVQLEESAALLVQEPAYRASSVVAACAVHQDSADSERGNSSCSATVQPTARALRLRSHLQALERRTLQRAWDRPPLPPSSLAVLDPTVASFIWWSLIPLGRRLQPEPPSSIQTIPLPSPPRWLKPQTPCLAKAEMEAWARSSNSLLDSDSETIVTSAVIGQQLIINVPVSSQ